MVNTCKSELYMIEKTKELCIVYTVWIYFKVPTGRLG